MENIGTKFRELRQKKNLTLDEVSDKTKIRKYIITAIEDGNLSVLPPVYLTYFVKTYAAFLKMPSAEINEILSALTGTDVKASKQVTPQIVSNIQAPPEKQNNAPQVTISTVKNDIASKLIEKKNNIRLFKKKSHKLKQINVVSYLVYTALILAIGSLIYFTFFSNGTNNLGSFASEADRKKGVDTAIIGNDERAVVNTSSQVTTDSLVLEAKGLDTAWLRVVVDGSQSETVVFYPELEKKWTAKEYILLTVGNEGAVIFKRNGQQLKPFGKKGTVIRNIKITSKDINVSSSPWHKDSVSTSSQAAANKPVSRPSGSRSQSRKKDAKKETPRMLELSPVQSSYTPFNEKEKIKIKK